jgi:uncharacterized membrane protein
MQNINKLNIIRISIIIGFAILYSLISLVNHYVFHTFAGDLGIFNQAIYDYAHFRINNNTVVEPNIRNELGDHFELILPIVSFLYYLFGSYTLLIVQIGALLLGGQGIFKYFEFTTANTKLAIAAMIQFFLFFGIYSALSFDYHNNVVGAMFVPWIFYFIQKNKFKQVIILSVLFLFSKENMALWGGFIFIGMMIMFRKDRKKVKLSAILCAISFIYFILMVNWIIPSLGNPGSGYLHFNYAALGNNMSEAFITIITKPFYTFKLLFANHLGIPEGNYVKTELHLAILFSGGILLFYRPYYLVMLIPIYAQKLFGNSIGYWGLGEQYSIEFIPILTIGAFSIIHNIKNQIPRRIITCLLILSTAFVTSWTFSNKTYTYFNWGNQRIFLKQHYKRGFDIKKAYNALEQIPKNAAVCAQDEFVSHLSFRSKIYFFPYVKDAEYIFLMRDFSSTYPLSKEQFKVELIKYTNDSSWDTALDDYPVLILKKNINK